MKKVIALICVFALALSVLASCGGSDEPIYSDKFVPIEAGSVTTLQYASGVSEKEVNTEEYREKLVEAYNSVTETKTYAPERTAEWSFIIVCSSKEGNTIFTMSGVGTNYINVSATQPGGEQSRYLVVNEDLYKFFVDEVLTVKEVSATITVKISLGADTPDGEGNPRETEVLIGEATVEAIGNEAELPTAIGAVFAALKSNEITEDYSLSETSGTVKSINGYEDVITAGDDGVDLLRWKYTVNGEAVGSGDLYGITVTDGTVITVVYTHEFVSNNE